MRPLSKITEICFPLIYKIRLRYFCQIFLFTEVLHNGVVGGLVVANHADGELSIALVHAPIPRPQTKEEAARDQIKELENVNSVDAQVIFSSSVKLKRSDS